MNDINAIIENALFEATRETVRYINEELNQKDSFPCGFAWITVKKVRSNSKIGKALIANGFSKNIVGSGLRLWNPSGMGFQNMDCKMAGAAIAANILADKLGIVCYPECRMD